MIFEVLADIAIPSDIHPNFIAMALSCALGNFGLFGKFKNS